MKLVSMPWEKSHMHIRFGSKISMLNFQMGQVDTHLIFPA